MSFRRTSVVCVALAAVHGGAAFAVAMPDPDVYLPNFDPANFVAGAPIDNPYFPIGPGFSRVLVGHEGDANGPIVERSVQSYRGLGPRIAGVQSQTVLDQGYQDGRHIEETYDYYAQDKAGNVWYLGEDVTNINFDEQGIPTGTDHEGAWRAGENDALPGWIMPNAQKNQPGFKYYQEFAPNNDALDQSMVLALDASLQSGGRDFSNVLLNVDTSVVEPDVRELKYYAPKFGPIGEDEGVSPEFKNPELVFRLPAPVPLPAGLPLLLTGLCALGLAGAARPQRRRANSSNPGTGAPSS